jgi:hypothetical protein
MVLPAMYFNRPPHRFDVIDPYPEVMQANEVLAALVAGIVLTLELQQRKIHHPIGESYGNPRM